MKFHFSWTYLTVILKTLSFKCYFSFQVQDFVRTEELNARVIQVLWEKFAMKIPQTTEAESRGALMLLGMAAGLDFDLVFHVDITVGTI